MGIRLSEKHGVNPTIPRCFFCGESKNEIVLMGKLKGDAEAPKNIIINYEPCDTCKEKFKEGVLVIEVSQLPNVEKQPPIQKDKYPTGRYALLKPHVFKKPLNKPGIKILMSITDYEQLIIGSKKRALQQQKED